MASQYASSTTVSSERTEAEIRRLLVKHGATAFMSGQRADLAAVSFEIADRQIRLLLPLPDRESDEFVLTPGRGRRRHPDDAQRAWEQACRSSWRALLLIIKAKLEAIASGITTVEREFLADVVLPDKSTVGEWAAEQLAVAYSSGGMPALLPGTSRLGGGAQ